MKNSQRGFTLIELMITVAVVAILAGIAYPSYRKQIMKSNRAEARTALLQVQVGQEKFFLQYNRYAGTSGGSTTELVNKPTDDTTPGLGIPITTSNGYYTIGLDRPTPTTYIATATVAGTQDADTDCKKLTIDNTGSQKSENSTGGQTTVCWK